MSQFVTANSAEPRWLLSARDAARALGICPKTLWNLTRPRGDLPCVRIGSRVLYDQRDLLAWIDGQKGGGA